LAKHDILVSNLLNEHVCLFAISQSMNISCDLPIVKGDKLDLGQSPKNDFKREHMKNILYASTIGSLMYA